MRDPDLMGRAQRAATELERAWERWRTMHGAGREPMPAVSSYVGYSLEEPWGQPRVVFGIEAREAEQLAALLERHDCGGPVYAGAAQNGRSEQAQELLAGGPDRGRVVVPTQAQATVAEREAAWREATWREATSSEQDGEPEPQSRWDAEAAQGRDTPGDEEPGLLDAQDADDDEPERPAAAALALQAAPAVADAEDDDDEDEETGLTGDDSGRPAEAGRGAIWARSGRGSGGHALPARSKRGGRGSGGR
jgi:hypothetical protein